MNFKICFTYHIKHTKQAEVVKNYYTDMGYSVDSYAADFLITPEAECRNDFFKRNPDADYILYIDSDEIILPEDLKILIDTIENTNKDAYRCQMIDYITNDSIAKSRMFKPLVAVINRTKHNRTVRFKYNRNISNCTSFEELNITIHHLGYLLDPQWKINNYKERKEFHELGTVQSVISQIGDKISVPENVSGVINKIQAVD